MASLSTRRASDRVTRAYAALYIVLTLATLGLIGALALVLRHVANGMGAA